MLEAMPDPSSFTNDAGDTALHIALEVTAHLVDQLAEGSLCEAVAAVVAVEALDQEQLRRIVDGCAHQQEREGAEERD